MKEIKNDESMKSSFEDYLSSTKDSLFYWQFWLDASDLVEINFSTEDPKFGNDDLLFRKSLNLYNKYLSKEAKKPVKEKFCFILFLFSFNFI